MPSVPSRARTVPAAERLSRLSHPAWAGCVGALALTLMLTACSRPEAAPEPVRAARTTVVAAQPSTSRLQFAAEVRPRVETRLGFRVGGKLTERRVNLGDRVRAGVVLARLDPTDLRLGQDATRAVVASAEVNLRQAEQDFERYRDLRAQGFISNAELERRETTLKVAQTQLAQARAQSGLQGNQAAYASLVADRAGVVTAVEAETGMVVAAGQTVVRIAEDGPRDAVFSVPEDRVSLLQGLQSAQGRVEVRLWGDDRTSLPATLREIAAAADPQTRTFLVKADLGQAAVRIGQTADVWVETPSRGPALRVPLAALREDRGATAVWVVEPQSLTVASRAIQVAGADGAEAIVATGLAPGERVVTAGVHVLTPGQKVRLYVDPARPPAASAVAGTGRPASAARGTSAPR